MNSRGMIDLWISKIGDLITLAVIAVVIFAAAATYNYDINTKTLEAKIITREIAECIITKGTIALEEYQETTRILDRCGYKNHKENIYVSINITEQEKTLLYLEQGDAEQTWYKELAELTTTNKETQKRKPGTNRETYDILIQQGGTIMEGKTTITATLT